jgi:hypothetical protein
MVNFNENLDASSGDQRRKLFTPELDEVTTGFFAGFPKHFCFCPTWPSRRTNGGHVLISHGSKLNLSSIGSRISYQLFVGEIKQDITGKTYQVLHRCGYGACINPWHLYLGTGYHNAKDRAFHRADKSSKTPEEIPLHPSLLKELGRRGTEVYYPNPLALSGNKCHGDKTFTKFLKAKCMFAPWVVGDIGVLRLVMWELVYGRVLTYINPSAHVRCTCESERCINPNHLELELPAIGREGHPSITHNRKMTPEKIEFARQNSLTYKELGQLLGVHGNTIGNYKRSNN